MFGIVWDWCVWWCWLEELASPYVFWEVDCDRPFDEEPFMLTYVVCIICLGFFLLTAL